MAYCRGGEDSDVYAFSDGKGFRIYVSKLINYHEDFYYAEDLDSFLEKMLELKENGLKIPDYTFERINREINGG